MNTYKQILYAARVSAFLQNLGCDYKQDCVVIISVT